MTYSMISHSACCRPFYSLNDFRPFNDAIIENISDNPMEDEFYGFLWAIWSFSVIFICLGRKWEKIYNIFHWFTKYEKHYISRLFVLNVFDFEVDGEPLQLSIWNENTSFHTKQMATPFKFIQIENITYSFYSLILNLLFDSF